MLIPFSAIRVNATSTADPVALLGSGVFSFFVVVFAPRLASCGADETMQCNTPGGNQRNIIGQEEEQ